MNVSQWCIMKVLTTGGTERLVNITLVQIKLGARLSATITMSCGFCFVCYFKPLLICGVVMMVDTKNGVRIYVSAAPPPCQCDHSVTSVTHRSWHWPGTSDQLSPCHIQTLYLALLFRCIIHWTMHVWQHNPDPGWRVKSLIHYSKSLIL